VESVLDLPMSSVQGKDTFRHILDARDAVDHFMAGFAAFGKEGGPFYPKDRLPVREVYVPLKFVAGPYRAGLDPPVRLVGSGVIRGERPPCGGSRCRPEGFPDCP
jgi:hypothetical protein